MPIERISPGKWAPVKVRTDYRADDDRWIPISGMGNIQIESCLERANEDIPVTISYTDYNGKEYTTPCVIRRDAKFILTKRIWCELR